MGLLPRNTLNPSSRRKPESTAPAFERDLPRRVDTEEQWIPAFAGMTPPSWQDNHGQFVHSLSQEAFASIRHRLVDQLLLRPELAVRDHGAERLDDDADADQRGDVGGVVRWRDLDHLEPAQPLRRHQPEEFQRLARQEAARLRPAGAGDEAAIDRVDVEGDVD